MELYLLIPVLEWVTDIRVRVLQDHREAMATWQLGLAYAISSTSRNVVELPP